MVKIKDVEAEELKRRAELQSDSERGRISGYILRAGENGPEAVRISDLSRREVWIYSSQLRNMQRDQEQQTLPHDEAMRLIQNMPSPAGTTQPQPTPTPNIPQHARDTLDHIEQTGTRPPGYVGDRPFRNDGRGGGQILPRAEPSGKPITYTEYDVHPYTRGVNRGAERVVTGTDGSAYYTSDHYMTFTKIK